MADETGNIVCLYERECSIQQSNQKLVEESPSPAVDEALRRKMADAAIAAARAVGYCNAGTIEFLLDKDNNFYFLEMNVRLQVEHGITEQITGIDIVKWQIRIASGVPLDFTQKDIAIDAALLKPNQCLCRRQVTFFHVPGGVLGVRFDSPYGPVCCPALLDALLAMPYCPCETREEFHKK